MKIEYKIIVILVSLVISLLALVIYLLKRSNTDKSLITIANIRWGIKELIKMYYAKEDSSKFSKKRAESGISFIIMIHGFLVTLVSIVKTMGDFAIWVGLITPFIMYSIYKIEKAKQPNENKDQV